MVDHESGFEIAGYRVESVIGRGGMAVVYRAEDTRLARKVALKLLTPTLAQNTQFRQRFIRESRLAASLDHPNIVPIYEAGEADGQLFIAMRYVVGGDLKALLESERGPLPLARLLRLFVQVSEALDAAHQLGLVHRDVKPGNILVTRGYEPSGHAYSDHVYLTDFGLTKRTTSLSGALTGTGHFLGTVDYVSPEQIQGAPLGPATDIYALGCVLYECLSGQVPFHRDDDAALLWAHLVDTAPPVSGVRPDLPPAVNDVVARAMAKTPDARYPSCRDLVRDLEVALGLVVPSAGTGHPDRGGVGADAVANQAQPPMEPRSRRRIMDMPSPHPSFPPGSTPPFRPPSGPSSAGELGYRAVEPEPATQASHGGAEEPPQGGLRLDGPGQESPIGGDAVPPVAALNSEAARRRHWPFVAVAVALAVLVAGTVLHLAWPATPETFRHYTSTHSVVPYSLDHPADWGSVEDVSSAVLFSPHTDVMGGLFFAKGAADSWVAPAELLRHRSSEAVALYAFALESDLNGASSQDVEQFVKGYSPADTRTISTKQSMVNGAVTYELEAVVSDPRHHGVRLQADIYVCQPTSGGVALFTFVATPDNMRSQRPRFQKVMRSVKWGPVL
jgi:serine/threonine protein kinase